MLYELSTFVPLICGVLALIMSGVVLLKGRGILRYPFTIFSLAMGLWGILVTVFFHVGDGATAELIARLYYVCAAGLIYGFILMGRGFAADVQVEYFKHHAIAPIGYLIGLFGISGLLLWPHWLLDVGVSADGHHKVTLHTIPYLIFAAYFIGYFLVGFRWLVFAYNKATHTRRHAQFVWVFLTVILALFGGATFNLILPMFGNYDLIMVGPAFIVPIIVITFYGIIRYSLFDIRFAVVRSTAYLMALSSLACVYYGLIYLVSLATVGQKVLMPVASPLNVVIALLLVFLFQPIKRFFDQATDKVFLRNRYDSELVVARLSQSLTSTHDLRTLLQESVTLITQSMSATRGMLLIYPSQAARGPVLVTTPLKHIPNIDELRTLDGIAENTSDTVLPLAVLPSDPTTRRLHHLGIAVVVKLQGQDGIIGYLCLGELRRSGYHQRDILVLATIANELSIAVQNALAVEEIRDLNVTLQQRIDAATKELRESNTKLQQLDEAKDEFISMASHQLRTPLTSIKGYIDMVLEGDAGSITDVQKKFLVEAFTSSERMVHIINDFLNVSRLQTGKFIIEATPVDLKVVVRQEVDNLKTTAKSRGLKLQYHAPATMPLLQLDEGKMRQVIMNFIDNAIYYSREGTAIDIKLTLAQGQVVFEVHDTGIGVPPAEQKELFGKFFRASNARKHRPDGTGVGLFLAKKVVVAHGGTVIFRAPRGGGSVFGFRLPIGKLRVSADQADDTEHDQK